MGMSSGQELAWTLQLKPELILAALVLFTLPLGVALPARWRPLTTWLTLLGLLAAGAVTVSMLRQPAQAVFDETYAVDPFALYFKLVALAATGLTLLATLGRYHGKPFEGVTPAMLALTCLGVIGLAASQDLALIALFLQITTVGSYTLVGMAKDERPATEAALKLFLFSAASSAVMIYGMTFLFGLTGTLRLPELAQRLPAAPALVVVLALCFVLAGYGYEITLAPFHFWAPDTYQGAPTPISGFLSVAPKAGGLAVLLRTGVVALPRGLDGWPLLIALLAALTMTVGNILALRQTSLKRLLAYSSIAQVGYMLVGVAAAPRSALGVEGMLLYLLVYLFMNLGAFLAVEALERRAGSDDMKAIAGYGRRMPFSAAALGLCLLSLAGFPPLGGFIAKTLLFGAALGAGWLWLAVVMAANVALSLYYYLRIIEALYLRTPVDRAPVEGEPSPAQGAPYGGSLRLAIGALTFAALASGIYPEPFVALASHTAQVLGAAALP